MSMSLYLRDAIIDTYFVTATPRLVLLTGPVTDLSTPFATEATGYTRPSVTFPASNGDGRRANTSTHTVTVSGTAQQTITHVGFATAASGGNMLVWDELPSPVVLEVGDSIKFGAGDLEVSPD